MTKKKTNKNNKQNNVSYDIKMLDVRNRTSIYSTNIQNITITLKTINLFITDIDDLLNIINDENNSNDNIKMDRSNIADMLAYFAAYLYSDQNAIFNPPDNEKGTVDCIEMPLSNVINEQILFATKDILLKHKAELENQLKEAVEEMCKL